MKDLSLLFKDAEKIKAKIEQALKEIEVEGSSGGGMVKVTMDGNFQVLKVQLDPTVVDEKDIEMLEDLILAAVNDAKQKAADAAKEAVSSSIGFRLPVW